MPLTPQDRELIRRCLHQEPGAWNEFVDRYLGLVFHVVRHTAQLRSYPLQDDAAEDIASAVLYQLVANDYAPLRQFRGKSSLSTYLTVIARRTCVQELARRAGMREAPASEILDRKPRPPSTNAFESLEEVGRLLKKLPERERTIVRMYHLEGLSYEEISSEMDIPTNTVGAILTRARKKMKGEEVSEA